MVSISGMLEKTWDAIQREHRAFIIYLVLLALPILFFMLVQRTMLDVDSTTAQALISSKNILLGGLTRIGTYLFSLWITSAVVYSCATVLTGQGRVMVKQDLAQAGKKLIPMVILSLVTSFLITFGFLLLIIPGIALAILCTFVYHEYLLEESSLIGAITGSITRVKGIFWKVFGRLVVLAAFAGLLGLAVNLAFTILFAITNLDLLLAIVNILVSAAVAIFTIMAITVLYLSRQTPVQHTTPAITPDTTV